MRRRYEIGESLDYHEENSKSVKPKMNIYKVPFYTGIIVLIYLGLLFGLALYFENQLPVALMVKDEVRNVFFTLIYVSI